MYTTNNYIALHYGQQFLPGSTSTLLSFNVVMHCTTSTTWSGYWGWTGVLLSLSANSHTIDNCLVATKCQSCCRKLLCALKKQLNLISFTLDTQIISYKTLNCPQFLELKSLVRHLIGKLISSIHHKLYIISIDASSTRVPLHCLGLS